MLSREQFVTKLFKAFVSQYGEDVIARFEINNHNIELTIKENDIAQKLVYPKLTRTTNDNIA